MKITKKLASKSNFTTKHTKGTKERKKNLLQGSILIHFMDYFLLIFNFLFLIFLNFLRVLRVLRGLNFKRRIAVH